MLNEVRLFRCAYLVPVLFANVSFVGDSLHDDVQLIGRERKRVERQHQFGHDDLRRWKNYGGLMLMYEEQYAMLTLNKIGQFGGHGILGQTIDLNGCFLGSELLTLN